MTVDQVNESHIDSEAAGDILAFDGCLDPEHSYLHSDLENASFLQSSEKSSARKKSQATLIDKEIKSKFNERCDSLEAVDLQDQDQDNVRIPEEEKRASQDEYSTEQQQVQPRILLKQANGTILALHNKIQGVNGANQNKLNSLNDKILE